MRLSLLFVIELLLLNDLVTTTDNEDVPNRDEYLRQKDSDKEMKKLWEKDHKQIKDDLREDIRSQYSTDIDFKHAPIDSMHETLNVSIILNLIRITHLDESNQKLMLTAMVYLMWEDAAMEWDPSANHDLKELRLHPHSAWVPPVRAAAGLFPHRNPQPEFTAHYTGFFSYGFMATIKVYCRAMDYGNFPFDKHNCTVPFYMSNVGMGQNVVLRYRSKGLYYPDLGWVPGMAHPELHKEYSLKWKILGSGALDWIPPRVDETIVRVSFASFWISFVRRTPYYGAQFVFPQLLASSFLFVSWILPLERKAFRLWMVWVSILAISVTHMLMYQHLPAASFTEPKIVRFSLLVSVLQLLSLLEIVVFARIVDYFKSSHHHPPPIWMSNISDTIARGLCYSRFHSQARNNQVLLVENPCYSNGSEIEEQAVEDKEMMVDEVSWSQPESEWCHMVRVADRLVFAIFGIIFLLGCLVLLI